jgi:hypothetical protein
METRPTADGTAAPAPNGQPALGRRALLGMALAWALARPRWSAAAATEARKGAFSARASLLFGAFRFEESGAIEETIDRGAGRYDVRITGRGRPSGSRTGSWSTAGSRAWRSCTTTRSA